MYPVRGPYDFQCFSYTTGPVRGLCGTRKGAVQQPRGHVRELTQPELAKLPHGPRIWPPAGTVHRLFTISKPVRGQ